MSYWVGERPYYDYRSNNCLGGRECRHYTQVVWRRTAYVGCLLGDSIAMFDSPVAGHPPPHWRW